jgi:hypothetical protein
MSKSLISLHGYSLAASSKRLLEYISAISYKQSALGNLPLLQQLSKQPCRSYLFLSCSCSFLSLSAGGLFLPLSLSLSLSLSLPPSLPASLYLFLSLSLSPSLSFSLSLSPCGRLQTNRLATSPRPS